MRNVDWAILEEASMTDKTGLIARLSWRSGGVAHNRFFPCADMDEALEYGRRLGKEKGVPVAVYRILPGSQVRLDKATEEETCACGEAADCYVDCYVRVRGIPMCFRCEERYDEMQAELREDDEKL